MRLTPSFDSRGGLEGARAMHTAFLIRGPTDGCICKEEAAANAWVQTDHMGGDTDCWLYHPVTNPWTDETCLCCERRLLAKNIHACSQCGCLLCGDCGFGGRYSHTGEVVVCYGCRQFGRLKNEWYWGGHYIIVGDKRLPAQEVERWYTDVWDWVSVDDYIYTHEWW